MRRAFSSRTSSAALAAALALACGGARAAELATSTQTLVVCDDVQDPATLDPHKQFSEKNHTLLQQVYEGLVSFDAEGRIRPALAESWERVDPLRMRFHLRAGVRFHDGTPFDSRAVVYSVTRYLDPATGFPAAGFISSIAKAEAVDARTVDVVTRYPDGLLLSRLAGFVLILAPDFIGREGEMALQARSAGTGPFKLERWERGRSVTLARNETYWRAGYPKVARLTFRFLPSEELVGALRDGRVDLATELPGTHTTEASRAGITVLKKPAFYAVTGAFNVSRGPLASAGVRRALNFAVNRKDLVRYDLFGNGRELASVTMDGEEGHEPALQPYRYDPDRARRLLAEAGYARGFKLEAAVKTQAERAARVIARQLARVGVTLELTVFTDAELPAALRRPWDVLIAGCPDPMAHSFFIQSVFLFSQSPYSLAANAAYDARLAAMVGALDDRERARLGAALDRYIHDEALMLFLYQRIKTYGMRPGVSFTPSVTGMPYFFDARKAASS